MTDRPAPAVRAARWHGETPGTWRERWGIPALHVFETVGSTNDVARALAGEGAPAGTTVIAEHQARGRGRHGRNWRAAPGSSLLMSVILRPASAAPVALPLRVGLAVARAIESVASLDVGIKWPNDLVIDGRKLGGILCETSPEPGRRPFVVAGIGLNVLQAPDDWPADLRDHATSLAAEGRAVSLPALAERVTREVSIGPYDGPLETSELEALAARDTLRGRTVVADGQTAGRAAGFGPDGALLVEDDGVIRRIISGTIRPADEVPGRRHQGSGP